MAASFPTHAGNRRALVETTDPFAVVVECLPLLDAGYDVVLCAGARSDQSCPALDGEPCLLATDADLVINAVEDRITQAAIARAVREAVPGTPLALITRGAPAERPEGCVRYGDIGTIAAQLRRVKRRHRRAATVTIHNRHDRSASIASSVTP